MRFIGNAIWFLFGGILTAIGWLLFGLILCVTIVGIPFGVQCFKFAKITLFPFGKKITLDFKDHPIVNTIWLILFGWIMALTYIVTGLVTCVTIIGIPFGLQSFKLAKLAIFPFGAKVI